MRRGPRGGRRVAQRGPGPLGALIGPDRARRNKARRHRLASPEEVATPDLQSVQTDGIRNLVHLLLVGGARLQRAESPKGTGEHVVRRHRPGEDVEVVDAVGAGRGHQRVEQDIGAQKDVAPRVGHHLHVERGDPAVIRDPGAVGQDEGMALAVADETSPRGCTPGARAGRYASQAAPGRPRP